MRTRIGLGILLAMALAGPAAAQLFNPFGRTGAKPLLTQGDYKIATAAVVKLLDETPARTGAAESWNNPATGNHGVFTILKIYTMKDLPCRTVNSYVTYNPKSGNAPRSLTLGACRLADGQWKTVP